MQIKATVIHHSADFDGIASREVAKIHLGTEGVEYIGWDFSDPKIPFPKEGKVYVIDLSPDCFLEMVGIDEAKERLVWIDHHKTAIEKWGTYLPGYRIDGVAACRLAWQWFRWDNGKTCMVSLPPKESFLTRTVMEPVSLMLLGEYDVWDHRGDGDLELQFGLRTQKEPVWSVLLSYNGVPYLEKLLEAGKIAMAYSEHVDTGTVMSRSFFIEWEGVKWLALNTARSNSKTFSALDVPETGHSGLMSFYWDGKMWNFSLYHADHRKDLDLSLIAKKKGGGGHAGACGFRVPQIPFPLYAHP